MGDLMRTKASDNTCQLCGSENVKILCRKPGFNILKCGTCAFIFNENWRVFSDTSKVQSDEFINEDRDAGKTENEQDLYSERFRRELAQIEKYKTKGKLLDVGSCYGSFLRVAKESGWQVYGVEIDKKAAEYCISDLGLDVYCGTLKDRGFPENYFDVVTLFRVFEHIPDFHETLSIIKKILKPDGLLVMEVPDVGDMRRKLFKQDWEMFRDNHLWYFSKSTLKLLLGKYGFKICAFKPSGGTEIITKLDKNTKFDIKGVCLKYYKYLKPVRNLLLWILEKIGFREHITVYAKNTDN